MNWKPNRWIAIALSMFFGPLGILYAGAPRRAALALGLGMLVTGCGFFLIPGKNLMPAMYIWQFIFAVVCMIAAERIATRTHRGNLRPWYTRWYALVATFATVLTATVCFRVFLYETYRVPSSSMAPAADAGSTLLVQKWGFGHFSAYGLNFGSRPISAELKRGDMLVFDFPVDPTQAFVMRLVGIPGDKIAYRNRRLFVNGIDVRGPRVGEYQPDGASENSARFREKLGDAEYDILLYADDPKRQVEASDFDLKSNCVFDFLAMQCAVPPGNYFVMGDNRDNSFDSRYWGFVRADQMIGKVVRIIK